MKQENTPRYIIIHCSATGDRDALDTWGIIRYHESWRYQGNIISAEEGLRLKKAHVSGVLRPWPGGGYHFYADRIRRREMILRGRPYYKQGAHCPVDRMNFQSLGICVIGNFDKEPPSTEKMEATAYLCAELCMLHKIPVRNIHGHRDHKRDRRTCPGRLFDLDSLRARVRELIGNEVSV